jgi:hypothetical protein
VDIGGGYMSDTNIEMVRGDTLAFALQVDFDEDAQNLDTAYFSCKSNYDDFNYVFQKSLNDGIEIVSTDENSVIYRVRVAPIDTKTIEPGEYFYDMQIGINQDVYTVLRGVLKIENDVTNS